MNNRNPRMTLAEAQVAQWDSRDAGTPLLTASQAYYLIGAECIYTLMEPERTRMLDALKALASGQVVARAADKIESVGRVTVPTTGEVSRSSPPAVPSTCPHCGEVRPCRAEMEIYYGVRPAPAVPSTKEPKL